MFKQYSIGLMFIFLFSMAVGADGSNIKIDVPVQIKKANVLFNMNHEEFKGESLIGLIQIERMSKHFKENQTQGKIVAVFHGKITYAVLGDAAYNRSKKVTTGNPFKDVIFRLSKMGVKFEVCANSLAAGNWSNSDLLPEIEVNSGAIFRIVNLVQAGYVQIQP